MWNLKIFQDPQRWSGHFIVQFWLFINIFDCFLTGDNGKPKLNEELQTRQWSDQVIRKEIRKWKVRDGYASKEVQVVVTPKVREEVRKHYGCASLSGAELEDQGEEGTALTHWEKRLFEVLLIALLVF